MQTFKHLMGFLLMGTVIFLLVSVPRDLLLYTVAFLVFVGLACWIWGRYATFDQTRARRWATVAVVLAVLSFGARASFVDMRRFFGDLAPGEGHLVWEDFDPLRLQRYHDQGRSVMLDFTADWCLTCKTNEKVVYESEEIVKVLQERGIVAMKADLTGSTPKTEAIKRLREKLGASSIPFVAIFPGDGWRELHTFKDLVTRGEIRRALEDCPVFEAVQATADR
jgi:thiol:disulfide interchange protein